MAHDGRNIRTVFTAAAYSSLASSILFDFGIYLRLGISFWQAPTGAVDHLQDWVFWFPVALPLCLAVLAAVQAMAEWLKAPGPPEAQAPGPSASPSFWGRIERAAALLVLPGGALCAGYIGYEAMRPFTVAAIVAYCWLYCCVHLVNHVLARHGEFRRLVARLVLAGVPSVMIIAVGTGCQYADFRAQEGEPGHLVETLAGDNGNAAPPEGVRIVRAYEKWLLVLEGGEVVWLNVNDGTRLRQQGCKETRERLLCVFGVQ